MKPNSAERPEFDLLWRGVVHVQDDVKQKSDHRLKISGMRKQVRLILVHHEFMINNELFNVLPLNAASITKANCLLR